MWATISLIVSNWRYFKKLYYLIEKGVELVEISKAFDGIDEAFENNKTLEDSKESAKAVNDVFRN